MPNYLSPPGARQASPPPYRPEQPYSIPALSLRRVVADLFASPFLILHEMAQDVHACGRVQAFELGIISANELRAHGIRPTTSLHVPPRPMPAPAPAPSRTTVCLGCGAPSAGLAACSYCLRRS